jgi:hypothetical protein
MSDRFLAEPRDFASGHAARKALEFPSERLHEKSHPNESDARTCK